MPMTEDVAWLAPLLQVSDSAFPTGSYAHSLGFEQMVRLGRVHDADSMRSYIEGHIWPALIHFELPVVRLAQEAARRDDLEELVALDEILDAAKSARELREASRVIGRRRLHAFLDVAPSSLLVRLASLVDEEKTSGHHAVIFGAGLASFPLNALLVAWAFQSINGVCLAAPKLLRIGQEAVQRVLSSVLSGIQEKIERSQSILRADLGWFDPSLEIASMHHEIAHERLFIS
jgi:urease accessory protein